VSDDIGYLCCDVLCCMFCAAGIKVNPGSITKEVVREQDGTLTLHLTNGEVGRTPGNTHRALPVSVYLRICLPACLPVCLYVYLYLLFSALLCYAAIFDLLCLYPPPSRPSSSRHIF
jgi:hypothetical protein